MARTIGFHGYFAFDRSRLSMALSCVLRGAELTYGGLGACMGVNEPLGRAFINWLRHTYLIAPQETEKKGQAGVTDFADLVWRHDPDLQDPGTLWLLHYYLCTDHAERSEAWHHLFNHFLNPGLHFTQGQFQGAFAEAVGEQVSNQKALTEDPRQALATYTNADALGSLGLLHKQKDRSLAVGSPPPPPTLIAGYMLFDWWTRRYPHTNTLRFSQLWQEEESLGRLLVASPAQVQRLVQALTGAGYLTYAETQHEPVNRLLDRPALALLERYYRER